MRTARLIAQKSAQRNRPRELQHVVELPCKGEARIRPLAAVAQVYALVAVEQLDDLLVGLLEALVIADDGSVLGHRLPQLPPQAEGIFISLVRHQLPVDLSLSRDFPSSAAIA